MWHAPLRLEPTFVSHLAAIVVPLADERGTGLRRSGELFDLAETWVPIAEVSDGSGDRTGAQWLQARDPNRHSRPCLAGDSLFIRNSENGVAPAESARYRLAQGIVDDSDGKRAKGSRGPSRRTGVGLDRSLFMGSSAAASGVTGFGHRVSHPNRETLHSQSPELADQALYSTSGTAH